MDPSRLVRGAVCALLVGLATGVAWAEDTTHELPPPPGGILGWGTAPAPAPAPAGAWDDEPPPPPPPPLEPDLGALPDPGALPEAPPPEPLAEPAPLPAPMDIVPAPVPVTAPRLEQSAGSCCWPRDDCGWALGPCGGRVGRTSIVLQGALVLFDALEGTLGEPRAGSLDWGRNDFDPGFGARVTLGHALTPVNRVEVRGVWYGDLTGRSTQAGAFGFSPPVGGTTAVTAATLHNTSELGSVEANWWHELCCQGKLRFSSILGARYLRLDETAFARMQAGALAPIIATVNSDVRTDLFAGQVGGAVHWLAADNLEITLSAKGLLGSMRRRIDIDDTNVFVGGVHNAQSKKTEFGWGAELEVTATHRVTRNFAATASYTLLFVNDVVRPNDAMNFSQANTGGVTARQAKSELLVHAFFLGFSLDL